MSAQSLDDSEPAAKRACVGDGVRAVEDEAKAKPFMPRTASLADDDIILVRQRDTDWAPQAVLMGRFRMTQSAFIDEAIELETRTVDVPAGTCQTQEDFIKLFTYCLYTGNNPLNTIDPRRFLHAWDVLGFTRRVGDYLDDLEANRSWGLRPDAITLFAWGRRFKRPKLVRMATEQFVDPKYKGPLPDAATLLEQVIGLWRETNASHKRFVDDARAMISEFRSSFLLECSWECPCGAAKETDDHKQPTHKDAQADDYSDCPVVCINSIAKMLGM
jgi:hypothetical protein